MKKTFVIRLLSLLVLFVVAVGGIFWFRYESSPLRIAERMLRSIPGLEAKSVRKVASGRLLTGPLLYRTKAGFVAGCGSAEIRCDAQNRITEIVMRETRISDLSGALPLLTVAAAVEMPPDLDVSGRLAGPGKGAPSVAFQFLLKRRTDGRFNVSLTFPEPRLTVAGVYNPVTRSAELDLRGRITPKLLNALKSRVPEELKLSGPFDIDARLELGFRRGKKPEPMLSGKLTFPKGTEISGGPWSISPGTGAVVRWNGRNQDWKVTLPETALCHPFRLPLGKLTVSGGDDSIIRFSIVNMEPSGKQPGTTRIDGHYDRTDGGWIFRQSESADRPVRWSAEFPFGGFDCVWRSPRVSGSGTRSRGGIEFSFRFESLHYRTPGSPRELTVQPGTFAGSWTFNCSAPSAPCFDLAGLMKSDKLDWPDPESAWSASHALVSFRYSQKAGEKNATLALEPEIGGVNLYGGGVPKLKLEGVSGKFRAGLDPAGDSVMPFHVEGTMEIRRVNPVQSIFGAGEFRNLQFSGTADLSSAGAVQVCRVKGKAEHALFSYPACEFSVVQPEFDVGFDRNAVTPGDNFLGRMKTKRLTLSVFGSRFSVPGGKMAWSGELRDSGLLPELWHAGLDFPAGTVTGDEFEGAFRSLSAKAEFNHSQPSRLDTSLDGFTARFGEAPAERRITADRLTFAFARDKSGGESGRLAATGGGFLDGAVSVGKMALDLPLEWTKDGVSGKGTLRTGTVTVPGGWLKSISAALHLKGSVLSFDGGADSPFWPEGALRIGGKLVRDGRWHFSGDFTLRPVTLTSPLKLDKILPGLSGMSFAGDLSGKGGFELLPERTAWNCELMPKKGTLSGGGIRLAGLSGQLRLAENGADYRNPGGNFRFSEGAAGPLAIQNGAFAFRLPHPGEVQVLDGSGAVWGGRARLSGPFILRPGFETEAGITVRNLEWPELLKALGLPPELIDGRADGTLIWRFEPDGKKPSPVSADLIASGIRRVKLKELEPYLSSDSNRAEWLELLRDFECHSFRLRMNRAPQGDILLQLSGSGRPAGAGYRKLSRAVDPADFGWDSEIDFSMDYRIPSGKTTKVGP